MGETVPRTKIILKKRLAFRPMRYLSRMGRTKIWIHRAFPPRTPSKRKAYTGMR